MTDDVVERAIASATDDETLCARCATVISRDHPGELWMDEDGWYQCHEDHPYSVIGRPNPLHERGR